MSQGTERTRFLLFMEKQQCNLLSLTADKPFLLLPQYLCINPSIYAFLKCNCSLSLPLKFLPVSAYFMLSWKFSWCLFFIDVVFSNIIYYMFVRNSHLLPLGNKLMPGWQIVEKTLEKIKGAVTSDLLPAMLVRKTLNHMTLGPRLSEDHR